MHKLNHMSSLLLYLSFLFYLLFSSSSLNVAATDAANPFTPKASLIRYWKIQISNDLPKPWFLLNKASPLTAVESATFSKLANDQNALANQLQSFCSSADLLCFPDLSPSLETQDDKFINWADPEVKPKAFRVSGPAVQIGYGKSFNESKAFKVAGPAVQIGYGKSFNEGKAFKVAGPAVQIGYGKSFNEGKAFKVAGPAVQIGYGKSFNEGNGMMVDGKAVNKWVEPGLFFRERMLKMGTIMPMPDIKDKLPKRSFLPRVISSKLPFSKISEMKRIFHAKENSSMASMLAAAVSECERAPNAGETKRCVGSLEDMIDFSISVLGHNVVVRTTENMEGSKKDVMIGKVNGINGGKVTKSVSCHQSLFPYLLYYCHSVLKVRVYEADILDPKTKAKINHGVAICHVDTSSWSAGHVAFMALGSGPGKIEVCHWIFENDMTWATAD
ncbi:polygalacturonase non-catalytic subunit AroGP2-like isoform X1 [Rhododendron vialii]|uniref:polygalacturonase non-catalytic subunit AroGP2-like isoform X1 n=1 Tax=Rhododendron vialii TaxID=182163 RepID=UPI00265E6F50|nr:polygalacturonase non-catalytic subunit AroGP2-like isoform X1 [Rhododendron vialii]